MTKHRGRRQGWRPKASRRQVPVVDLSTSGESTAIKIGLTRAPIETQFEADHWWAYHRDGAVVTASRSSIRWLHRPGVRGLAVDHDLARQPRRDLALLQTWHALVSGSAAINAIAVPR